MVTLSAQKPVRAGADANRVAVEDLGVHDWYRFVLSFPPHLVREYLKRFDAQPDQCVLDPFCGTGTTVVECKKRGIPSIGVEANPMAHFATSVKVDWSPDPDLLLSHARSIATAVCAELQNEGMDDDPAFPELGSHSGALRTLDPTVQKLLLTNSISPRPLHKTLALLENLRRQQDQVSYRHELLALARCLVFSISNLHFGPEVGVGPAKVDTPVVSPWMAAVRRMSDDLQEVRGLPGVPATIHHADSRQLLEVLQPGSVDMVITSPPYPNEKDYTRTTRLESVLLGFIRSQDELRALKRSLVRSNTRGVYRGDNDDDWVAAFPTIQTIAETIEKRRIELGKTSGFERQYAKVTRLYFGGMARHLAQLRSVLRPGAHLAYVVGDQASYLRVMIRTGQLLAEIAHSLGYDVLGIDLFRTRLATATGEQLREEVLLLRWPGSIRVSVRSPERVPSASRRMLR